MLDIGLVIFSILVNILIFYLILINTNLVLTIKDSTKNIRFGGAVVKNVCAYTHFGDLFLYIHYFINPFMYQHFRWKS